MRLQSAGTNARIGEKKLNVYSCTSLATHIIFLRYHQSSLSISLRLPCTTTYCIIHFRLSNVNL